MYECNNRAALLSTLEGAVIIGGVSALGAALAQIGVPRDQVVKYDTALKADKYVLMVHGNEQEVGRARSLLVDVEALEPA